MNQDLQNSCYDLEEVRELWQQEPDDNRILRASTEDIKEYPPEIQTIIKQEADQRTKAKIITTSRYEVPSFFSFEGRINRASYILTAAIIYGVQITVGITVILFLIAMPLLTKNLEGTPVRILAYVVGPMKTVPIVVAILLLPATSKRLHDLSISGGFCPLVLVPVVNIILTVLLAFKRGTTGPNKYGPDPLGIERV